MRVGNSFKRKDITEESMKLKGSMDVDPSLREALTDADEGIFRPGALPKMQTSSTNGNKLLLDAVEKARACGWHVVGTRARTCNCLTTQGQMHYVRFLLGYHGYPIFSLEIAHTPSKHPLMQVVAAPKKRRRTRRMLTKLQQRRLYHRLGKRKRRISWESYFLTLQRPELSPSSFPMFRMPRNCQIRCCNMQQSWKVSTKRSRIMSLMGQGRKSSSPWWRTSLKPPHSRPKLRPGGTAVNL